MPSTLVYNDCLTLLPAELASGEVAVLLVDDLYRAKEGHTLPEVERYEIESEGYDKGGQLLTGARLEMNNRNELALFADSASWPQSSIQSSGCVVYHRPTSRLVCYHDFDSSRANENGLFSVLWNERGIVSVGR